MDFLSTSALYVLYILESAWSYNWKLYRLEMSNEYSLITFSSRY